ncbi:LOW QUALITY PROTEIN: uncharacterized protein EMH_0067900 [Eimeria mitis]|uniref:Uncharacterized protein n=1 Tax=Eimeria mitis TaxID=44415 RepID=U6KIS5_9EIME|nr:LOW QUALITY PROTEIN: uncharacterized protein EMH_0067900 [Eimeria mitis]CDJ36182.1 hypothetical protein EMH_0067900 [Eimeria mitis]
MEICISPYLPHLIWLWGKGLSPIQTRKVVFPRLFGSLGRRALSDSELEDKWLDECSDEEEEGWEDEGDEGGGSDEIPAAETGEPVALQTLEELRGLMTLGVETTSCLRVEYRGFMLLLLLTISTQELALYGIHSTPEVEVERQRTLDFIVEKGRRALAELDVCDQSSNAASKAEGMLKILEEFRTPRPGSNAGELAVQAKLSEYRISQCRDSLQQLQHWVQNSLPIPEAVSKRALRIVISTRIAGKSKIMGHMNTKSWVEELQRQHNFFEIIEPRPQGTRLTPRTSFRKEIRRVEKSYTRLARLLAEDVRAALNQQPAELRLKGQHQQGEHRQQQDRQSLQPQHHQLTQQTAVNIAGTGSVLRPAEEPANLGNFVGVMSSHASRYPPHARHRPMRTRMPSWLRPPMRQSTQPPRHDPRQHSPPTHPERWYLPHCPVGIGPPLDPLILLRLCRAISTFHVRRHCPLSTRVVIPK